MTSHRTKIKIIENNENNGSNNNSIAYNTADEHDFEYVGDFYVVKK